MHKLSLHETSKVRSSSSLKSSSLSSSSKKKELHRVDPIDNLCPDFLYLCQNGNLKNFLKVLNFMSSPEGKLLMVETDSFSCTECTDLVTLRVCLNCFFVGCNSSSTGHNHSQEHYKKSSHKLTCLYPSGVIFCYECDSVIVNIMRPMSLWNYNYFDKAPTSPLNGFRGLINLGNTCYMNSIIQALTHTPALRKYFLTFPITCNQNHENKPCIAGCVSELFQLFYNGDQGPLSLHILLLKTWQNATHLSGYEQHDAHEFFIAMLQALHCHFQTPTKNEGKTRAYLIDTLFLGNLESVVMCTVCGHKSYKVDPFWDTSLDLMTDDPQQTLTLKDCLKRYTRVEHLGRHVKILCDQCNSNQESTKQLKFKKLPMILSLHLKRFEHSVSYKKIDTKVNFPSTIHMDAFTTDYNPDDVTMQLKKRYSLFAVVNHIGSHDAGHYYSYIFHSGKWIKCDDHTLTYAHLSEVLDSPGYLLFYQKDDLP